MRRLLASGDDVRVYLPLPSAAHEHADLQRLEGPSGSAGWRSGPSMLVVHLDAALLASAGHREGFPARLALAAALRSAGRSTVYLPPGLDPPSDGWAGLVLDAADEVLTEAEEPPAAAREAIASGRPDRSARRDAVELRTGPDPGGGRDGDPPALRRPARRRPPSRWSRGVNRSGRPAVRSLQALPILGVPPPRSANPLVATVKRAIQRLVAWQIDPVIEHVNLLQRVVAEAVDPETEPRSAEVVDPN